MDDDRELCFDFINAATGSVITGSDRVAGYRVADFFTCNWLEASEEELKAGYKGPDIEGIGIRWTLY